jgi:hypothetical protein
MKEKNNIKYFISKRVLLSSLLLSISVLADQSPLCNDLARFACAPGSYKDGTGEIKSESEISKFMSSYADKSRTSLHDQFQKLLNSPENSYFKDVAIAGLGLKNSPQCSSTSADDISACRENLIDGLTTIAQKQALGPLMPKTGLERAGNFKDWAYIIQNNSYQKVIKSLNDQVQKDLGNSEMTKKIKDKIFPKVKELIIARLKKLTIPDEQRNLMISKISSITFEGTSCEEIGGGRGQSNGEVVSSLLVPNAFYDPSRNIFKLCSGYLLQSTSEFQVATTIAHELSHSIDPCIIAVGPVDLGFKYSNQDLKKMESEYPIKNIIQCLRDNRSIGARNFSSESQAKVQDPSSSYPNQYGQKIIPNGYGIGSQNGGGMPVGQPTTKASFCDGDQIGESFSDWMAIEVLPIYIEQNYKLTTEQYRNGYANARRLICSVQTEEVESLNKDVHPAVEKRINKIILVNPKVRAQMGCPTMHTENIYCDSEKSMDGANEPNEPNTSTAPPEMVKPAGGVR